MRVGDLLLEFTELQGSVAPPPVLTLTEKNGFVPRRRRSSVIDFLSLEVPVVPAFEEQERIAAALDAVDALRVMRRRTLANLDTLTKAVFVEMFGNPVLNGSRDRLPIGSVAE